MERDAMLKFDHEGQGCVDKETKMESELLL